MLLKLIYIVEDDPIIASTLSIALQKHGYSICGEADNSNDALIEISNRKPDLVLIDIQLTGKEDGVSLALKLDHLNIPYIYITSQNDPLTTEKVNQTKPLGYIPKPFTENGLISAIKVACNNYTKPLEKFITFNSNHQTYRLQQSQILYLEAYDNYCYIITASEKYLVAKTLKHVHSTLNPSIFIKSHRSYVVNISKVNAIKSNAISISGFTIPLSARQKSYFKALL